MTTAHRNVPKHRSVHELAAIIIGDTINSINRLSLTRAHWVAGLALLHWLQCSVRFLVLRRQRLASCC